uniref:Uncharacterized protein MANES_17G115100 n=1 Tax=Rhizophora mucronata TaxID=61149 RepID=A0A2P2LD29_RHIMU
MAVESLSLPLQSTAQWCPVSQSGRNSTWPLPNFSKLQKGPSKIKATMAAGDGNSGIVQNPHGHGIGKNDGVIIVDHGSRRRESNLMLNEFVAMFRVKTKYPVVEPAHMELAEPSIRQAFDLCVRQGSNRVIVSPFFLSPGRHWHQDIPTLTAEAAKEHPGVSYLITAPLGLHELLVDVVNDRINHCLSHIAGEADECAICFGTNKCNLH